MSKSSLLLMERSILTSTSVVWRSSVSVEESFFLRVEGVLSFFNAGEAMSGQQAW
ncbi:hypothetical protein LDENG_00250780 [Lucifuga dentata]|nr:hypothetical protein LDENG_00250780 [Lucifuga dentata]